MLKTEQMDLMPGVHLTAVCTDRFKSSHLSLRLLMPLKEDTAARNAILPFVLRRGTSRLPDMTAISSELDDLYGGMIEPAVRKCGDVQCVGFEATFLDDGYAPNREPLVERATSLLGEMLLRPATKNARLRQEYVKGEKENLIRLIQSSRNDKRQYAAERLTEEMYAGTDYATSRFGTVSQAEKIGARSLYGHYLDLLGCAPVELFYCGSVSAPRVELAWRQALMGLPRLPDRPEPQTDTRRFDRAEVRKFGDTMDVTQGKLELGFQTGVGVTDPMYPAVMVANAMFGGTSSSRLFLHVREKRSLCYYASSSMDSVKGFLHVACGVEPVKFDEAQTEILHQLDELQNGNFTTEEFETARRSVVHALRSARDEQGAMCSLWLRQRAAGAPFDIPALIDRVSEVTEGEAAAAAMQFQLDSIYRLSGQREEGGNHA